MFNQMRNYRIQFNESSIKNLTPNDLQHLKNLLRNLGRIQMNEEEKSPVPYRIISQNIESGSLSLSSIDSKSSNY